MRPGLFIHVNVDTVMKWPVKDEMKLAKVYFGEWASNLKDIEVAMATPEDLRTQLYDYVKEVQPSIPKPDPAEKVPAAA